ncbi:E3 ubiquitin-protein ligase [Ceratobasidium sp. AG-Ba]|nr:E3 ubiquitin-protein ligase [Ceratobasidium sp. AG-Ba]
MNDDEDFETLLELTAQLQLEDIQEWRSSLKGKNRVGVVSDVELSINSIEAHHKTTLQNIADRRFARSVHRAVTQDSSLIAALAAIEEQERSDRELALKLSINANANAQQPAPAVPTSLAHTILSRTKPTDNRSEVSSSSSKATVDESLFPPRCCNKQISFQDVRAIFSPQLIRAFEQKAEEYKTTNRLYCHNPRCSAFLGPAVGNERDKVPGILRVPHARRIQKFNRFSILEDRKAGSLAQAVIAWWNSRWDATI